MIDVRARDLNDPGKYIISQKVTPASNSAVCPKVVHARLAYHLTIRQHFPKPKKGPSPAGSSRISHTFSVECSSSWATQTLKFIRRASPLLHEESGGDPA